MSIYPHLLSKGFLQHKDTAELARAVHNGYRTASNKRAEAQRLLDIADVLIEDLKTGRLPPNKHASLHLLSFFKAARHFEKGQELWAWLHQQDEKHLDAAVYGAAIELLSVQGHSQLQDMEDLYQEALKRFPGTYAEYHLSPNAIVPDRSQPVSIHGLPITLLQGILTARIFYGDWRNAYLALDTVLRLFPTQVPPRYFELFLLERPLAESYHVFIMACRCGTPPKPPRLTQLLDAIDDQMGRAPLSQALTLTERMIDAIAAYSIAGGKLSELHLSVLIRGLANLLPNPYPSNSTKKGNGISELALIVSGTAQAFVSAFAQAGILPGISTSSTLIDLAGKARMLGLFEAIYNKVSNSGASNPIWHRSALKAAGQLGDSHRVETTWTDLKQVAESEGRPLERLDWLALAKACRRAGCPDLVKRQTALLEHTLTENIQHTIEYHLDPEIGVSTQLQGGQDVSQEAAAGKLDGLAERLQSVLSQAGDTTAEVRPFEDMGLRTSLVPSVPMAAEPLLREIYDSLTTDPSQPSPPAHADAKQAVSPTGITLAELRFLNWCSVNQVMESAQLYEARKLKAIDLALKEGKSLKAVKFPSLLWPKDSEQARSEGISNAEVKQRILDLRQGR